MYRDKNMTEYEKEILKKFILMHAKVICNKRTDASSNQEKKFAWEDIAKGYNSQPGIHHREASKLKKAWENMRKSMRLKILKPDVAFLEGLKFKLRAPEDSSNDERSLDSFYDFMEIVESDSIDSTISPPIHPASNPNSEQIPAAKRRKSAVPPSPAPGGGDVSFEMETVSSARLARIAKLKEQDRLYHDTRMRLELERSEREASLLKGKLEMAVEEHRKRLELAKAESALRMERLKVELALAVSTTQRKGADSTDDDSGERRLKLEKELCDLRQRVEEERMKEALELKDVRTQKELEVIERRNRVELELLDVRRRREMEVIERRAQVEMEMRKQREVEKMRGEAGLLKIDRGA